MEQIYSRPESPPAHTTKADSAIKAQFIVLALKRGESVISFSAGAKFFTQDQIHEYKECFSLYDHQRRGKIEAQQLITVMRCLGSNPTPAEVQRHLLSHSIDRAGGEIDFSTLLTIMHRQFQQEAPQAEITEALRMADKEQKGFILASELRSKLTSQGEKLTDREVDELLKEAGVGTDGRVHCEQFAKAVTRSSARR
ncbi:calmodulin-like protein 4 [Genypterus blacodes]|uniref:calmodulin-like protein 4 n=1 Tax=Genypterus blacodes TaxID=154954 RepID=UPI003F75C25F